VEYPWRSHILLFVTIAATERITHVALGATPYLGPQ
jgi:hypothetical protein